MTVGEVVIEDVWKAFRIYHDRNSTLKQRIVKRKRDDFEEFQALKGVSFTVKAGTTTGIVGANGAGKSTMLKVLSRILVPDKGTVRAEGTLSALLELGAGFHPELTGRENIFLNGTILGMSKADLTARLDDIIGFAGLEHAIDKSVKTYSSGMFARLGFAVAVSVDPDILIVDEVLAVGDEQFQRRCVEKINELRSGGRTVIIVSHSLGLVQQICDHAIWLNSGQVAADGRTIDVVNKYLQSVASNVRIDAQGRQRQGTGEVQLEFEMLVDGQPATSVPTDSRATLRFLWSAEAPVDDVDFEFMLRSTEGISIGGARTGAVMPIQRVNAGSGVVEFQIERLTLLPGSYQVAAFARGRHSGHFFDGGWQMAGFDVVPTGGHNGETGYVSFDGSWRTDGSDLELGES